jgi:response regulator RpfG family c-di-GMP phosphodiesterase
MLKNSCNISQPDVIIRYIIALITAFLAIYTQCYLLLILSMVVGYTAITRKCYIYRLFNINRVLSNTNYYKARLPLNNPSPVMVFGDRGEVLFANPSATQIFNDVANLTHISKFLPDDIISSDSNVCELKEHDNKVFQIEYVGINRDRSIYAYINDVTEVTELNDEIEKTQKEVIYAMGEIGESRSKETGNHVKRVANYSKLLALKAGLSLEEAELLKVASPMHDIGKVGIADEILNKPGKLTEDEFIIMKTHAQIGYDLLKSSNKPILKAAAIVAGEHHEKYDGSGYPEGKRGEEIHIYGRITAIADVFDALGSDRVYKKAWELDQILAFFKEQRGKHFDPKLLDLFFENLDEFLAIRDKYVD